MENAVSSADFISGEEMQIKMCFHAAAISLWRLFPWMQSHEKLSPLRWHLPAPGHRDLMGRNADFFIISTSKEGDLGAKIYIYLKFLLSWFCLFQGLRPGFVNYPGIEISPQKISFSTKFTALPGAPAEHWEKVLVVLRHKPQINLDL